MLLARLRSVVLINVLIIQKVTGYLTNGLFIELRGVYKAYSTLYHSSFLLVTKVRFSTAMSNMSAVAQKYGNSHQAFIIVPLVCAFFIDLANALIIPYFIT